MQQIRFKTLFKEKEFWILALVGILYFYRPLFLGETFFFRDLTYDFIPQKQLLLHFLENREWPLWDIYRHGGQPYFADPNNSVFHPINLLFLILPFFRAFNLFIVLHALLYSLSTYLFTRILGFNRISSMISAVVYGYCGYSLSLINLFGRFLAMSYLPLLFLFWHLCLREQKRRWYVFTVIIGVLQVFSGAPEVNVISLLALLGWTVLYPYQRLSIPRRVIFWILLGGFIIGISSVQLLPTMEMAAQSSRGSGVEYSEFSSSSLHPKRMPELFVPNFLGSVDLLPYDQYYWGLNLIDGDDYPYIINMYVGAVALIFAIFGGFIAGDEILPRRLRILLFVLFLCALSLSLGRSLPFFYILYRYVPMISLFRYPIKFLLVGLFPLALLTGYASERFFNNAPVPQRAAKVLYVFWIVTLLSGLFTLAFLLSPTFARHVQLFFFEQFNQELISNGLRQSFIHVSVILLGAALLYHSRLISPKRWQHWGLAGLLLLDLLSAGKGVNVYASEEFFTEIPPIVQAVNAHIDDGRLLRTDNPADIQLYAPSNEVIWGYSWNLETLDNYLAAFYHIPVLFHDDYVGLGQNHLMTLKALVKNLSWQQKMPILSASRINTILTSEKISLPEIQYITSIPNRSNTLFHLYRNTAAMTRAAFLTNWDIVHSDEEALQFMLQPAYNPRTQVVLQAAQQTSFSSIFRGDTEQKIPLSSSNSPECPPAQIDAQRVSTHAQIFSISTDCDGYLVFSEPFYPGWNVSVDTVRTPIFRANFAFSAIFLAKGEHRIERYYFSRSLLLGILASLLSCSFLGIFFYISPGFHPETPK